MKNFFLTLTLATLLASCDSPTNPDTEGAVSLSWSHPTPERVLGYRVWIIYEDESELCYDVGNVTDFELPREVFEGAIGYQLSAYSFTGLESSRSELVQP